MICLHFKKLVKLNARLCSQNCHGHQAMGCAIGRFPCHHPLPCFSGWTEPCPFTRMRRQRNASYVGWRLSWGRISHSLVCSVLLQGFILHLLNIQRFLGSGTVIPGNRSREEGQAGNKEKCRGAVSL